MTDKPEPTFVLKPRPHVTPTELRWAERADNLQFEALEAVRGAAEKWAASLVAILGLAGTVLVVKGREDVAELDVVYQVVVAVLLLLGFLAAVVAVFLAARAAQGTPKEVRWPNGAKLRRWERDQARDARLKLTLSRRLTFVAISFIAAAVAVTWFGEGGGSESSSSAVIVTPDGRTICGEIAYAADGGTVQLAVKESGATARVTMRDARSVVSVDACPSKP